jgi:hypothetical protein
MAFDTFVVIWYSFPRFGQLYQKIWQSCSISVENVGEAAAL